MKRKILILSILISILFISNQSYSQVDSTLSKSYLIKQFYAKDSLVGKQVLYDKIIRRYPEQSASINEINYDGMRRILALNYLTLGDTSNFNLYFSEIQNKTSIPLDFNEIASNWLKSDQLREAARKLSMISLMINDSLLRNPATSQPKNISLSKWKRKLVKDKVMFTTTYSRILDHSGQSEDALEQMNTIYRTVKKSDHQFWEYYSLMLGENGKFLASNQIIEMLVLDGYRTRELDNQLEKNYILENMDTIGFAKKINIIDVKVKRKLLNQLKKKFINKENPGFALKDSDNKIVSFDDLKGKIVVIDFWATWCAPCREMFPIMQTVVDKYKDNPLVEFLFIDTWETEKNYQEIVKKFILDYGYTFKVIYDEKDDSGIQQKVSTLYGVKSLPTRIIIDSSGSIRLKEVGFAGSKSGLFNELSTVIDFLLTKKRK